MESPSIVRNSGLIAVFSEVLMESPFDDAGSLGRDRHHVFGVFRVCGDFARRLELARGQCPTIVGRVCDAGMSLPGEPERAVVPRGKVRLDLWLRRCGPR